MSIAMFTLGLQNELFIDADYMVIIYEFSDGKDLDTRTRMVTPDIGQNSVRKCIGFGNPPNYKNILKWGGDNSGKGFESVLIDFKKLIQDYPSTEKIKIDCRAWWYQTKGIKPVKLRCMFYNGGTMILDSSSYLWKNPTALTTSEIKTNGNIITELNDSRESYEVKGQRMSVFNYNTKTKIGSFNSNDITTPDPI